MHTAFFTKRSLVLFLLLSYCLSSLQLTYSFPYNSDGTTYEYLYNPVYKPVYDLGVLEAGYFLQMRISFPNLNSASQLSDQI